MELAQTVLEATCEETYPDLWAAVANALKARAAEARPCGGGNLSNLYREHQRAHVGTPEAPEPLSGQRRPNNERRRTA
jgi:hypothetical protein